MHDHQLMYLIKLWASGNKIQSVAVNEVGNMQVTYFDMGGNFFDKTLTSDNKLFENV